MASPLSTAAPSWARKVWADATNIYLEIPCANSVPFIQVYSKTDGGIAKALDLICLAFRQEVPQGGHVKVDLTHPKTKTPRSVRSPNATQAQRDLAAEILKKLGIT